MTPEDSTICVRSIPRRRTALLSEPGQRFRPLVHPSRKILDTPPIYEFATPVKGTLPIWYDPSYWTEGAVPRVSLKRELSNPPLAHVLLRLVFL